MAGVRHGVCELMGHGMAGEQHGMCELAFNDANRTENDYRI
jgi:hypothetical protein